MTCSSMYLMADMMLWSSPQMLSVILEGLKNISAGDSYDYDCALSSAPCESNLTKSLISMNPGTVFWFDFIRIFVVMAPLVVLGFVGNIFNIVILSRNKIASDSTNNLLLATSVSDLIHIVCLGTVYIAPMCMCLIDTATALSLTSAITNVLYNASRWLAILSLDFIVVLSIQRAVAIVFPFRVSMIFSYRKTNSIIVILIIVAAVPLFMFGLPRKVYHPYFDKHLLLGFHFNIELQYGFVSPFFISRLVAALFLLITTVCITVYKLNVHVKNRINLNASTTVEDENVNADTGKKFTMSARELSTVKMSIAVCLTSFVIYFIDFLSNLLLVFAGYALYSSTVEFVLSMVAKIFNAAACSFNFFLYIIMSSQFREIFIKMFRVNYDKK